DSVFFFFFFFSSRRRHTRCLSDWSSDVCSSDLLPLSLKQPFQLRAQERLLQREREAEGDEFADKEKFVTGAYKAQQDEVRRMERSEERRVGKEWRWGCVGGD